MRMMTRITLALAIALATVAFAQGAAIDCVTDEPATITYIGDPVANLGETERATAAAFMEACPHITVEIIPGPASTSELLANYLVMFEGRSGDIDVLRVDVIHPGILADNLVDLLPYFSDEELAAHFPGYIANTMMGDRMVAIAFRLGAGMLYYRTDLLEKYGFDGPPATWDDLDSMAATIQAGERAAGNPDFWGFVWQGDNYEGLTTNALEWQVSEGGGTVVNRDLEPEVNNEATIRAMERAAGWVGTISPPGVTGYREEDARAVWHVGNAAFMRNWPYAMASSATSEAIAGDWEVAALPAGASGTYAATMGGWTLGVNRYSANVDAAVAFAKYFASYEEQKRRAVENAINPTIAALYEDADVIAAVPAFAGLNEVFMGATPRPSTATGAQYDQVSSLYSTAVHAVLTGELDADTAMTLLELDLEALLGN
jgi:trehalose/maltose transport system substrate-binding protein